MRRYFVVSITIALLMMLFAGINIHAQETPVGTIEYFYSPGCGSCQEQAVIWDKWLEDNREKLARVTTEKINVSAEHAKALSRGYNQQGIPYFQVKNKYGEVISTGQGTQSEEQLDAMVAVLFKPSGVIEFTIGKKAYIKNGKEVEIGTMPFIRGARAYVPLRALSNSLGIHDENISYSNRTIILKKDSITIELKIGLKTIKINESLKEIDAAPVIEGSYSFLPARYVAEALGYVVKWKDGRVIVAEPENKLVSKSVPDPIPVLTEGEDKYYDLENMLMLGGLAEDDFFFENEDILILNDNPTYSGLVLTDEENKIYLIGKDGQYFKYDLADTLTFKDGKWLVKNDDVLRIGMLATILNGE